MTPSVTPFCAALGVRKLQTIANRRIISRCLTDHDKITPSDTILSVSTKSELMSKIKSFGLAGTLSYIVTELAFWTIILPGVWIGNRRENAFNIFDTSSFEPVFCLKWQATI
jgi:hypothetical protein